MYMWHPVAPEEIGDRWEHFHDCYFPQLPTKNVTQDISLEETMSWVFFTEKLPLMGMGCFSAVFWEENIFSILFLRNKYLMIFVLWRSPLEGSSWKLRELTSVIRFLAYVSLFAWNFHQNVEFCRILIGFQILDRNHQKLIYFLTSSTSDLSWSTAENSKYIEMGPELSTMHPYCSMLQSLSKIPLSDNLD